MVINAKSGMYSFEETSQMIRSGLVLAIAADTAFLEKLPQGTWLGGSSPYMMSDKGPIYTNQHAFVQVMPNAVISPKITAYDRTNMSQVFNDGYESGFSMIVVPFLSEIYGEFFLKVPHFPNFARQPLVGWGTGPAYENLGKVSGTVHDGSTGAIYTDKALVMHLNLPASYQTDVNVLTAFDEIDPTSDVVTFLEDAYEVKEAMINGKKIDFVKYLIEKGLNFSTTDNIDNRPLNGNLNGIQLNAMPLQHNKEKGTIVFAAPIFKGVEYRFSKPINPESWTQAFKSKFPTQDTDKMAFTCNCAGSYFRLQGQTLGKFAGPYVFGEIAYHLFNNTLVYLNVEDKSAA